MALITFYRIEVNPVNGWELSRKTRPPQQVGARSLSKIRSLSAHSAVFVQFPQWKVQNTLQSAAWLVVWSML